MGFYFQNWCSSPKQQHRVMRKWENGYLRIGGNRCSWSSYYRSWFQWMIIEGYLHQSNTKSILSRITEPIHPKLQSCPLNSVNEGRSIHTSTHSISLRIVNVFFRSARWSPSRVSRPSWMDCSFGKSESSIHPFHHSQTQPIEHTGMEEHRVRVIVVEEDLWIQTNPSIKPVNENDGA